MHLQAQRFCVQRCMESQIRRSNLSCMVPSASSSDNSGRASRICSANHAQHTNVGNTPRCRPMRSSQHCGVQLPTPFAQVQQDSGSCKVVS